MRRGRLPAATIQPPAQQVHKPSPSPLVVTDGDPFAALDSKSGPKSGSNPISKSAAADDISARFPTLDQFSILHEQGTRFEFDSPVSPTGGELGQTVAERLAVDVVAMPKSSATQPQAPQKQSNDLNRVVSIANTSQLHRATPPASSANKPSSAPSKPEGVQMSRASAIISSNPELQAIASPPPQHGFPTSSRPVMVSTGTMTSTPPPTETPKRDYPPIHRFPPADHYRSSSLPRQPDTASLGQLWRAETPQQARPGAAERVPSFQSRPAHIRQPSSSSRPSLEGGRPSTDLLDPLAKSSSQPGRARPASTHLESNIDFLREREAAPRPSRSPGLAGTPKFPERADSPAPESEEDIVIESNVDFLRSMEQPDKQKKDKDSKHSKRSSLSSLSGTKSILASRFGDAFKRFEGSNNQAPARTPSPLKDLDRRDLTPIAGSEATDSKSDDGRLLGDQEELTPEQRRDAEARALAGEERRVEAAAAEYRQRVAAREQGGFAAPLPRSIGGASRAVSIQNRVQNLLQESQKPPSAPKTAAGYGRFADGAAISSRPEKALPELPRKPVGIGRGVPAKPASRSADTTARTRHPGHTSSMPAALPSSGVPFTKPAPPPKPSAPPKPTHLNSISTGGRRSPSKPQRPLGPTLTTNTGTEQLVGVGLPGRPSLDMTPQEKEDYVRDFSKRFPSLSAIEMVERDLGAEDGRKGGR